MASKITFKGNPIHTTGKMPDIGSHLPSFKLVAKDLSEKSLADFKGKKIVIATVPSLDTGVCSLMTQKLNEMGKKFPEHIFLVVSADLPFAQGRFCEKEKVQNVQTLSMMRDKEFGKAYGLLIADGPLAGLLARSVLAADENGIVVYNELVPEITHEPDYQKVEKHLS